MDLFIQFGGGFLMGFVAALSPGPDTVLVLRSVTTGGARAGARTALGIGTALAVHALLTVLLVTALRDAVGSTALRVVQVAGGAYLGYLGITLLRGAFVAANDNGQANGGLVERKCFAQGFLTNLTNPKAIVFFASVVSQFLASQDVIGGFAVLSGVVLAVPVWFVMLSYASTRALGQLSADRRRLIDLVAGAFFLGLASYGIATAFLA